MLSSLFSTDIDFNWQGLPPNDKVTVNPMKDSLENQIAVDYEHSANLPDILQALQTSVLIPLIVTAWADFQKGAQRRAPERN